MCMGEPLKPARPITRQLERFTAEAGVIEEWLAMPAAATMPITVVSSIFRMNAVVQAVTRMVEPIGIPGAMLVISDVLLSVPAAVPVVRDGAD